MVVITRELIYGVRAAHRQGKICCETGLLMNRHLELIHWHLELIHWYLKYIQWHRELIHWHRELIH